MNVWKGPSTHFVLTTVVTIALACDRPGASDPRSPAHARAPVKPLREYVVDGVATVEYGADAFERAPQWVIDTVPLATYGGPTAGADYEMPSSFGMPVFLSDGRLAVAGTTSLLIYAADGRGERVIGRRGRGPGEFSQATGVAAAAGDTLVVPDFGNSRLNWITADGEFVRTRSAPFLAGRVLFPRPIGTLPNGRVVLFALQAIQAGAVDSVVRRPTPLAVVHSKSGELRVVAGPPGPELARPRLRSGRPESMPVRFGRASHAVVWDTIIAIGTGESGFALDLLNGDGVHIGRLRVPVGRRPIPAGVRDSVVASELERADARTALEGERSLAQLRERITVQPVAESLPPYAGLYASRDGMLWVLDAIGPGDTSWTATAFRRDYTLVARVRGRGRRPPVAFAADRVVVSHIDDDGFEVWRAYGFMR